MASLEEQVRQMHQVLVGVPSMNEPGLGKRLEDKIAHVEETMKHTAEMQAQRIDDHERRIDLLHDGQLHQKNTLAEVQRAQAKIIAITGSIGGGIGAIVGGVVTFVVDHWEKLFGK